MCTANNVLSLCSARFLFAGSTTEEQSKERRHKNNVDFIVHSFPIGRRSPKMEPHPRSEIRNSKSLARALDEEFKRISQEEDIPMGELVEQVALLAETSARSLYNYRSGKWPLPSHLIPIICRRFRSRALVDLLNSEIKDAPIDLPSDSEEAWEIARAVITEICQLFEQVKQALDHDLAVDHSRLDQIDERADRINRHCRLLRATAARAMAEKLELRRKASA
jgi:hypothetical protein